MKFGVALNEKVLALLDELVGEERKNPESKTTTRASYLFHELRRIADLHARLVNKLEVDGTLDIGDNIHVTLDELSHFPAEESETGVVVIQMGQSLPARLERTVALIDKIQRVRAKVTPEWSTFKQWIDTVLPDTVIERYAQLQDRRAADDEKTNLEQPESGKKA